MFTVIHGAHEGHAARGRHLFHGGDTKCLFEFELISAQLPAHHTALKAHCSPGSTCPSQAQGYPQFMHRAACPRAAPASSGQEEGRTSLCTRGYFSVHALPMSPRCRTSLCIRGRPCPAPSRTTPPPYGPPAPEERMQRKCHGDALRINAMRINTMRINVAGVWTALGLQHLPLFWRHLLVTILIDLGHKLLGL